jgi:uncharacterized protein (DUF302 family)
MREKLIWGLCTLFLTSMLHAGETTDTNDNALAIFYTLKGDVQKEYNELVENKLRSIGFELAGPHKRVNDKYEAKWGSTQLDVLSFMPIMKNQTILPLLNIDPRIAGFAPFNMLIYKKLDENVTKVGHLMPKVMLDILGIEDESVRRKFSNSFKGLDATIAQELGGEVSYMPYKKLPEQTMINFEYTFEAPEDIDDFIDEFQNKFSLTFIDKGYLIAGFNDLMYTWENEKDILSQYDAFWTYSLCHLEFSYNVFDTKGARPDAGLFAPCTMYMYIKKGTNKLVLGMYRLQNWADTLDITDPRRLELITRLDKEIPQILTEFGMKSVPNINPLLASNNSTIVPKQTAIKKTPAANVATKDNSIITKQAVTQTVVTKKSVSKNPVVSKQVVEESTAKEMIVQKSVREDISKQIKTIDYVLPTVPKPIAAVRVKYTKQYNRGIGFSKRVPPNYVAHSFDKQKKETSSTRTTIGGVVQGRVSAHLRAPFMEVDKVKEVLSSAGFEILSAAPVNKKGTLVSIVFTNDSLISMASKTNRGFMATLRVLVDTKEKYISILNPLYLAKGFLQDDFDEPKAKIVLSNLLKLFPKLKNSKDALKYQLLPKYQFMQGMPKYEDMVEVAVGTNLVERLKNNEKVVFTKKLENGATIVGIKLSKRTRKFTKRIGRHNAGMLPYPILIENGKAMILDPKYYISIMYPSLTMSEFMTIATTPDAMIKDCEKVFRNK